MTRTPPTLISSRNLYFFGSLVLFLKRSEVRFVLVSCFVIPLVPNEASCCFFCQTVSLSEDNWSTPQSHPDVDRLHAWTEEGANNAFVGFLPALSFTSNCHANKVSSHRKQAQFFQFGRNRAAYLSCYVYCIRWGV